MPTSSSRRPLSRAAAASAGPASASTRASSSGCVHIASRIFDTRRPYTLARRAVGSGRDVGDSIQSAIQRLEEAPLGLGCKPFAPELAATPAGAVGELGLELGD